MLYRRNVLNCAHLCERIEADLLKDSIGYFRVLKTKSRTALTKLGGKAR